MSSEEQELLARIGQIAGQINRHRTQQDSIGQPVSQGPIHNTRHNTYRYASAPYRSRGNRYGRGRGAAPGRVHHHRTLQLNNTNSNTNSDGSGTSTPVTGSRWVSRTDRHRQLINASVFEKDSQSRAKAIEETRKAKARGQRSQERARLKEFLRHQAPAASATATATAGSAPESNELTIEGIRFRVADRGRKLLRIKDDSNSTGVTPKSATVAGVKFHRTKTGNFVISRIVKDHRRSGNVKKIDEPCRIFSSTGSCPKGPSCRYIHDPNKVALCKTFLKEGKCPNGESCDLSHDMTPERVPNCLHYAKGQCTKVDCPYTHSKASPSSPVCYAFGFRGYCDKGADCTDRHVFECPDFSNTGKCKVKGCKLLHRERASVLRNRDHDEDESEDVSSDEEPIGSDDVDSDEIAEFIDADSDLSDDEGQKDFLPI